MHRAIRNRYAACVATTSANAKAAAALPPPHALGLSATVASALRGGDGDGDRDGEHASAAAAAAEEPDAGGGAAASGDTGAAADGGDEEFAQRLRVELRPLTASAATAASAPDGNTARDEVTREMTGLAAIAAGGLFAGQGRPTDGLSERRNGGGRGSPAASRS